jgi:hypothetical protein
VEPGRAKPVWLFTSRKAGLTIYPAKQDRGTKW